MKICFYSPYVPNHFGGGEKHLFDVIQAASNEHTVFLAISPTHKKRSETLENIKKRYSLFLDTSLDTVSFIETPLGTAKNFFEKLAWTRQFDAIYYVTDGSLFFSLAKKNFLHIQVPFVDHKSSLLDRLKLLNWKYKNTNSNFTKQVIEKNWRTTIDQVIHPMVDISEFNTNTSKKNTIVSVGRFFTQLHSKRQDVLVEIFTKLIETFPDVIKGWSLVLAGSVEDHSYLKKIKIAAKGLPIQFETDISRSELNALYEKATFYWHAAGFDVDESIHPEKVEHFGITTVEAMAAGAIPLVHFKGGQKEILGNDLQYLGWQTKEECVQKTVELIKNIKKQSNLKRAVKARAKHFSKEVFNARIKKLFSS